MLDKELGIFILLIWYLSLFASKHLKLLQSFSSPGSKIPTFLQSQITNFRITIIDCLNNDRKCTFISIYQRLPQIQCHLLFFMLFFEIFSFICFSQFFICLFACYCIVFYQIYSRRIGKT